MCSDVHRESSEKPNPRRPHRHENAKLRRGGDRWNNTIGPSLKMDTTTAGSSQLVNDIHRSGQQHRSRTIHHVFIEGFTCKNSLPSKNNTKVFLVPHSFHFFFFFNTHITLYKYDHHLELPIFTFFLACIVSS